MAISQEQLDFAREHFDILFPNLLEFPNRHQEVSVGEIKEGFDLKTTMEATFKAYELFRLESDADSLPKVMRDVNDDVVFQKYLNSLWIIRKNGYRDLTALQDSASVERMRPSLYRK
jgi:hypothetical protein